MREENTVRLSVTGEAKEPVLRLEAASHAGAAAEALLRRAEALTAEDAGVTRILVEPGPCPEAAARLVAEGAARRADGRVEILPGLLWQVAQGWLPQARPPFPELPTISHGRRHPLRPEAPEGLLYRREIPWLGQSLSFRTLTEPGDVALFSRWMNDDRVAAIWDERGDLDRHRAYLEGLQADPHMLPLFGCLDDKPFAYFELYWAKENRLGPLYAAADYDRGWHVAVGEEGVRGRRYVSAWLPSLMHFLFLDDPRTRRIVGEPRADHAQQIRNLHGSGFSTVATVDFPHKRAALVMLTRDHFFRDRLWVPGAAAADATPRPAAV
ncbi:acetyltransferase [Methylobacterium organophilum]|uniref:GNAT family N-acetyltransferase n=1 Tax=Methylobacterium organophilum TaxID=410 RepID=UPI001F1478EB|nr:GNAT family N-acetyltransferase [Methylobacterium organophilum]UMY16832.1 acetyltransferase [Methylobacterium organophilum]